MLIVQFSQMSRINIVDKFIFMPIYGILYR